MTRIAIVHDYLTQRGGAERLVLSMAKAFPDAPLYTSLYDADATFPEFRAIDVRPMAINKLPFLRRDHRRGLPLYPAAFSNLKVDADVLICSSSGFAHGTRSDGVKVVYSYTSPRWLYDEAGSYMRQWAAPVEVVTKTLRPLLRRWDQNAASSADAYLTSSTTVQARISRDYGIHAEVVPPGTSLDAKGQQTPVGGLAADFVLCVSRLLSYKNVDTVAQAFRHLPDVPLVIVGTGPEEALVRNISGPNVQILPRVTDAELRWLYAKCSMIIAASFEDFGLTPVEAGAWGKPVAALRAGGYLDTVQDGLNGRFFDDLTPKCIVHAVSDLLANPLPSDPIVEYSQCFTEKAFIDRFRKTIEQCVTAAGHAGALGSNSVGRSPQFRR